MDSIKERHPQPKPADETILTHFDLIARGGLLQHVPETWLDGIRLAYEEALMPEIQPEVKRIYEAGDYRKTIDVARVILNIDPFNDVAIKYKLKALRRTKGILKMITPIKLGFFGFIGLWDLFWPRQGVM